MARIRTFIAVDISDEQRTAMEMVQQQLQSAGLTAKWVRPDDFHITLHFLGEINEREVGALCNVINRVAKKAPPLTLGIAGLGAFPNLRRPKTIWAGVTEGAEELSRIHDALRDPLAELGCYRHEDRRYTPHLTLGRCKAQEESEAAAAELAKYATWSAGSRPVHEIRLYRSESTRKGFEYSILGRGELRGKPVI